MSHKSYPSYHLLLLFSCLASLSAPAARIPLISARAATNTIGMGRSVEISARATFPGGAPAAGWLLLPYCNGQRWGAHEFADSNGCATFHIPLPRPGLQSITISALPPANDNARWIWPANAYDNNITAIFSRIFVLSAAPTGAIIAVAADDLAHVAINGQHAGSWFGWQGPRRRQLPPELFRPGSNLIEVTAFNSAGPAGLLLLLNILMPGDSLTLVSDTSWAARVAADIPAPVQDLAGAHDSIWHLDDWPTRPERAQLYTGAVALPTQPQSPALVIHVQRRELQPPPKDPRSIIIMHWANWFSPSPMQAFWKTAQAVPLLGFYRTANTDVMRQHIMWMIESGVDVILCDMSNNIWFDYSWDNRAAFANELFFLNQLMLETLAAMRDEGFNVPRVVLHTGVNHTTNALAVMNEQLAAAYHAFVNNDRWGDLVYRLDGKPLMLVLALYHYFHSFIPQLDPRWTYRYVTVQLESHPIHHALGYWSWSDHYATTTLSNEAITASIGAFPADGWLDPRARARRGGATFLEDWQTVMRDKPRHIFIHQFQEFHGAPEGFGDGPNRNRYFDTYSVDLSDDIEPTSLTTPAYRGNGGWGFFYLNLVRACVDLLHQDPPQTSVLAIAQPDRNHHVAGDQMTVIWRTVGKPLPHGVNISIDNAIVASNITEQSVSLDISSLAPGSHTLTLTAPGALQRYRLSWTEDSLPLPSLEPATVSTTFIRD